MHYIIGDIHGEAQQLDTLLQKLGPTPQDTVVFTGDYVGYGPEPIKVVQRIMGLSAETGAEVVALRGDHEDVLDRALINYQDRDLNLPFVYPSNRVNYWEIFKTMGGTETLRQLALLDSPDMRQVTQFVQTLPYIWQRVIDGMRVLVVHAGIDPTVDDILDQRTKLVTRIKYWQELYVQRGQEGLSQPWDLIVHGHTPTHLPAHLQHGIVNVDGGAGLGGKVAAYVVETRERFFG